MSINLQQKSLIATLIGSAEKIIESIRYNLKILEQCSLNIVKARQDKSLSKLFQQELVNGRHLIKSLEINLQQLEKCRRQLLDMQSRPSLEMENIGPEVFRAISVFTNANPELNSKSIFDDIQPVHSDEPSKSVNHNNSQRILSTKVADENVRLKNSNQRLQQYESINRDLIELNEIATNMSVLVHGQGNVIDTIEANINEASENINEGTKSLIKASGYAGALGPITCAAIGGAVLGPVGAVVGLKIGIASAVGGSVISYCGAKYVRNKKLNESQGDVNQIDQAS